MGKKNSINVKNILGILFLVSLFISCMLYWDQIKHGIRIVLEEQLLYIGLFGYTIMIFIWSFISNSNVIPEKNIISSSFGGFFDTVINAVTYGAAITSSLTLIKGFYIQKIFNDKQFFYEFSDIDVWLLFLTMCFLLYFCMSKVIEITKNIIVRKEDIEPN